MAIETVETVMLYSKGFCSLSKVCFRPKADILMGRKKMGLL